MRYTISSIVKPTNQNNLHFQHSLNKSKLKQTQPEQVSHLTMEVVSALRESGLLRIAALDIAFPSTKT